MGPRAVVAAVAALSLLASAAPAESASLAECGQRVIRDWYSGGRVDKVYPLPCYREAIRSLPDDVLQYTDASHDIERALAQARRGRLDRGERSKPARVERRSSPPSSASPSRRPRTATGAPRPKANRDTDADAVPARGPARRGPDIARVASGSLPAGRDGGVPYPLIALGALAPILLVSGLVGALARRRR